MGPVTRCAVKCMCTVLWWLRLDWLLKPILRRYPKLLTHEHLDCSLRPETLLELWSHVGFDKAEVVSFPDEIVDGWRQAGTCAKARRKVAGKYQRYVAGFASASLKNYVDCIVWTVLPVMQTRESLHRITRERIEDAVADGVIGMELRFAPQLHTAGGLSLDEVMETVITAVKEAPIPVSLIVCALRHEDATMAKTLADLCVRYKEFVGKFDLAGDERGNPGVLSWWLEQALRIRIHGIEPTVHLWETDEPTEEDLALLRAAALKVLGHGFRGGSQGDRICTMCVTSNVVTGQVESFQAHPIEQRLRQGVRLTVETDGTLFTGTDATTEYFHLMRCFGWGKGEFLVCNLTALEQMPFEGEVKKRLRARLLGFYL